MPMRSITLAIMATACAQSPVTGGAADALPSEQAEAAMPAPSPMSSPALVARTADEVRVYGTIQPRSRNSGNDAHPVIMLFHQGGSNGRGDYAEIGAWLASEGFTSIAWDTRSGGDLHGATNRTVQNLPEGVPSGFCDALPDLLAALDEAEANGFGQHGFVLWGSSDTGALVFHAAAERPELARGVIAFSPASGEPMRGCLAIERAAEVQTEMLVFQPPQEVIHDTAAEQRLQLEALGASYVIVEGGVHGASMLLDGRTGEDMAITRKRVIEWLKRR